MNSESHLPSHPRSKTARAFAESGVHVLFCPTKGPNLFDLLMAVKRYQSVLFGGGGGGPVGSRISPSRDGYNTNTFTVPLPNCPAETFPKCHVFCLACGSWHKCWKKRAEFWRRNHVSCSKHLDQRPLGLQNRHAGEVEI